MTTAMKQQMAKGQRMIAQAEFSYGFKDISREQFEAMVAEGNALILAALDSEKLPESYATIGNGLHVRVGRARTPRSIFSYSIGGKR